MFRSLVCLFCMLLLCSIGARPSAAAGYTADEVRKIIHDFAPIMELTKTEPYLMEDPDVLLDTGQTSFVYGKPINYPDYHKFRFEPISTTKIENSAAFAKITPSGNCSNESIYGCYIYIPRDLIGGEQDTAARLISVSEQGDQLYLGFWFFYPFNGPGRSYLVPTIAGKRLPKVNYIARERGRHWGDWEHVTLRVTRTGSSFRLSGIFLSRHSFAPWIGDMSRFDCVIKFGAEDQFDLSKKKTCTGVKGEHPLIFVAINSHAHYPKAGDYVYHTEEKTAKGSGLDIEVYDTATGGGDQFDTSLDKKRRIISSNVAGLEPDALSWYSYKLRWGQFLRNGENFPINGKDFYVEADVERGPEGPVAKSPDWLQFADWQDSMASVRNREYINMLALTYDDQNRCCAVQHNLLDGRWQGWQSKFHESPLMAAVVRQYHDGTAHLFGVGTDHNIYHNWRNGNDWQNNEWVDPTVRNGLSGGIQLVAADMTKQKNGWNQELFGVRNSDGKFIHTWYASGKWASWDTTSMPGLPSQSAAIVTAHLPNQTLVLFALDPQGKLYQTEYSSTWSKVAQAPGNAPLLQTISITSGDPNKPGSIELIGVGMDAKLYHAVYKGGGQWDDWTSGKSSKNDFPPFPGNAGYATLFFSGNVEALVTDQSGILHHAYRAGDKWVEWDGKTDTFPKSNTKFVTVHGTSPYIFGTNSRGNSEIFAVSNQGDISHTFLSGTWRPWSHMFFDGTGELMPQ